MLHESRKFVIPAAPVGPVLPVNPVGPVLPIDSDVEKSAKVFNAFSLASCNIVLNSEEI